MPKCVICDGGSILGVQFLSKNFPHYNVHQLGRFSAVFATARGAKFDPEYLCIGSTRAADIFQFRTSVCVLAKCVTKSWHAYRRRPTDGTNLAKKIRIVPAAVLVNRATKPGLARTVRPTDGASLAKNPNVHGI